MQQLLGMRLEEAEAILRQQGVEPRVLITCAPRRKGEEASAVREGTMRVIRVRELKCPEGGELTVSAFQDGEPRKE